MVGAYDESDVTAQMGYLKSFVCIPALFNIVLRLNGAAVLIWEDEILRFSFTDTEGSGVALNYQCREEE